LEKLLTAAQVADRLGITVSSVYLRPDDFGAIRTGKKAKLRYPEAKVEFWHTGRVCARPICEIGLGPRKDKLYCSEHCARLEMKRRARERNPEVGREALRRWKAANPGRMQELNKRWYEQNRERALEQSRRWQVANPERVRELSRLGRQRNIEKARERDRLRGPSRKAARRGAPGVHSPADVRAQFDFQGGVCFYCAANLTWDEKPRTWHLDHVIPISRGGSNGPENIVCACASCNQSKGAKTLDEWTPPLAELQLLAA
jgi:5-methylcytosine-specific restriction endonuclease McrA